MPTVLKLSMAKASSDYDGSDWRPVGILEAP